MKKSLTLHANKEIKTIHGYSRRLNRILNKDHAHALLDMIKEHAGEIKELIKEAKQSPDAVLFKCYPRFHKKLLQLIKDQGGRRTRGL